MPRPRKNAKEKTEGKAAVSRMLTVEISESVLETALRESLRASLQPIQMDINTLTQQMSLMEQELHQITAHLNRLPKSLTELLSHSLAQLQSMLSNQNSSQAKDSLQKQLQQLITALSSWNAQLKTEVDSQQQLIDSMKQLEEKLTQRSLD